MKQKILHFGLFLIRKIVKGLLCALGILIVYLSRWLSILFEKVELFFERKLSLMGIWRIDEVGEKQESLFTKNEILDLAKNTPNKIQKLKEIEEYHGVSYRQARKIKSKMEELRGLTINQCSA